MFSLLLDCFPPLCLWTLFESLNYFLLHSEWNGFKERQNQLENIHKEAMAMKPSRAFDLTKIREIFIFPFSRQDESWMTLARNWKSSTINWGTIWWVFNWNFGFHIEVINLKCSGLQADCLKRIKRVQVLLWHHFVIWQKNACFSEPFLFS